MFLGLPEPGPKVVGWGGNLRALAYRTGLTGELHKVSIAGEHSPRPSKLTKGRGNPVTPVAVVKPPAEPLGGRGACS